MTKFSALGKIRTLRQKSKWIIQKRKETALEKLLEQEPTLHWAPQIWTSRGGGRKGWPAVGARMRAQPWDRHGLRTRQGLQPWQGWAAMGARQCLQGGLTRRPGNSLFTCFNNLQTRNKGLLLQTVIFSTERAFSSLAPELWILVKLLSVQIFFRLIWTEKSCFNTLFYLSWIW